jgi:hypothetical protein
MGHLEVIDKKVIKCFSDAAFKIIGNENIPEVR